MSPELLFFLMRLGEAIAVQDRPDMECVGQALYNTAIRHQDAWNEFNTHWATMRSQVGQRVGAGMPLPSFADAEETNPAREIALDCDDEITREPMLVQAAE